MDVLANFKKINKKEFRHIITIAGMDLQDAMFDSMVDFIFNEMVPDTYTYDYTKLFGLQKGKGRKLDLNMIRYILEEMK